MKILLLTVAGISSRFSASLGYECLKCIYYKDSIEQSLLYRMLYQDTVFDKYIIVGGYQFKELEEILQLHFTSLLPKITLVENKKYREFGSGYSLYTGLRKAADYAYDELVFAEGDLYVDSESFRKIFEADQDVVTSTRESIQADKAVAFYYDRQQHIHYLYDTAHQAFVIREPFTGIFHSGQVWKFTDNQKMNNMISSLSETEMQGTNLAIIQKYFYGMDQDQYQRIIFSEWVNCNTVQDFDKITW